MDWQWRADVENAAYEELRSACLENNVLAAPDFTKQFYADSDASDDGKGHVTFQLKNPELPDTLDNRGTPSRTTPRLGPRTCEASPRTTWKLTP